MKQLNNFLDMKSIAPKDVLVLRNQPGEQEPQLKKCLSWLAAEHPEVYNVYQSTPKEAPGQVMKEVQYVASFIGNNCPGKAFFIGLYKKHSDGQLLTRDQYYAKPGCKKLKKFGHLPPFDDCDRILWFDLKLVTNFYPELKGQLIVKWPYPNLQYRRADWRNSEMWVDKTLEQSVLDAEMPD